MTTPADVSGIEISLPVERLNFFQGHAPGPFRSHSEWLPRLQRNAGDLLPVGQLERIAALVAELDALDDVSDLLRDLQPADGRSA
jgi:hypothetical protein